MTDRADNMRSSHGVSCGARLGLATGIAALVLLNAVPAAHAQTAAPAATKGADAGAALQRGNLEQAILLYNAALDDTSVSNDRRAVLLAERGVALMQRRNFKAALDDFNKSAALYPEYAAVYVDRGNLLLMMAQGPDTIKEAIKDFDRALALSPKLAAAYGNRGAAQLKLGAPALAVADFNRAISLQPLNPAALNGRGRARQAMNQMAGAYRDYSRALVINSGFAQGYRNRAGASMRLGKATDAVADLSRALVFDPRRLDDYAARGQAYLTAGNAAAAATDFAKVVELDPKSVEGHIGLGLARANTNAVDEAVAELSRAIELEPRSARAYAVRAWVYIKSQQIELGQKDVDRALRLEPVTADAYWALGELKEAATDREAATAAYSRALGLNIEHRETLAALVRLGLEPQTEELAVADGGRDGWRVAVKGRSQFVATHPQFANLRVGLEMMGAGEPRITGWERQKSPYSSYGLLHYTAGALPGAQGPETVTSTAIVDLKSNTVVGNPLAQWGDRTAKYTWGEEGITVVGADGLSEIIGDKRARRDADDKPDDQVAAAKRRDDNGDIKPERSSSGSQQSRDRDRDPPSRQASSGRKPKTLFDLIFGN